MYKWWNIYLRPMYLKPVAYDTCFLTGVLARLES